MKKRKNLARIIVILIIFILVFCYYIKLVHPVIKDFSKAKISALTEQAVNEAVSNVINTTLNYDKIININYTTTGEISYLHANQYVINSITREVVKNAQQNMLKLGEEAIPLPLGSFTGISIFNGRGPNVKLQMVPVGIISSSFKSQFTSVGINNTLHQLYLDINAKVELILPVKNATIITHQTVLLCEGVIVGKVPEFYLSGGKLEKNIDLIP